MGFLTTLDVWLSINRSVANLPLDEKFECDAVDPETRTFHDNNQTVIYDVTYRIIEE